MTHSPDLAPRAAISVPGNVFAVISMVAWASGFPAAEVLLATWDPLAMVLGRFLFAMALLVPIWLLAGGLRRAGQIRWAQGMWIGGIGFGGGAWAILVSQWFTDPVTVAIIAAATPLAATLVAWWYDRQPLSRGFVAGLVATLAGGIIATGVVPSLLQGQGLPGNLGPGALFAVVSAVLFSWGSYRTVVDMPDDGALTRTVVTGLGALVFIALAYAAFLAVGLTALPPLPPAPQDWWLLALYGIVAFGVSQLAWIASADRLGVAVAAFHINIAPFYVMLILVALGGAWSWPQAIGAAVVAAGVILAQRR
jgi:drug/metabolite transporter (DMT)-like permease